MGKKYLLYKKSAISKCIQGSQVLLPFSNGKLKKAPIEFLEDPVVSFLENNYD